MFTLVTYNILHGYHKEKIAANIKSLLHRGADIFCIQEAELAIEEILTSNWQVEYFFTQERGCRLAIAFNKEKFKLLELKKVVLPALPRPDLLQKFTLYSKEKIQRGALIASLVYNGRIIKVINTHLAWEGGTSNRLNQLRYLLEHEGDSKEYEILCGDFNTLIPSVFRRTQEMKVENVLGTKWTNLFPGLKWSCDIAYTAPQDGLEMYTNILKIFGIKFRSRLDYIFSHNLKATSNEMLDLPGSDHRPLLTTFSI